MEYQVKKLNKNKPNVIAPGELDPETLITPKRAAEIFGLNVSLLAKYRVEGRGSKYFKLGKKVMYKIGDLEAWLNESLVIVETMRL